MRLAPILVATLAIGAPYGAQDADVEKLLARRVPEIQEQIARIFDAFNRPVDVFKESQKLKELTDDEEELVKQLAIFAVNPSEEQQPLKAVAILRSLHIPPKVTIRVLAPYLDADHPQLRGFVREWFRGHDNADYVEWGAVNYKDYRDYVGWKVRRNEEVPAAFVRYIYERSPGKALLIFRSGNVDVIAQLHAMRKRLEATQQGRELTEQEQEEVRKLQQVRERERRERREIILAEHIISNAIWLNKHGFDKRFHEALPEAMAELEKLAKHKEWWARLYVVHIMRRHPPLLRDYILRQLSEDSNELVSEAAKSPDRR